MESGLPTFPEFKTLQFEDKKYIDQFTKSGHVFSDYNFMSLWSWDISNERKISVLNKNLVILFTDYISGKPILSIYGENELTESVRQLLRYAKEHGYENALKYVPEHTAVLLDTAEFELLSDEDNSDYIYRTNDLALFEGGMYKSKRKLAKKATETAPSLNIKECDPTDIQTQAMIFDLLTTWKINKESRGEQVDLIAEQKAILRIIKSTEIYNNLLLTCAFSDEKLVGFSIDEIARDNEVVSHYFKTDNNIIGLAEYFNKKLAEQFFKKGILYWNWEQDLGLDALKKMKRSYRPHTLLKKFIVSNKKEIN